MYKIKFTQLIVCQCKHSTIYHTNNTRCNPQSSNRSQNELSLWNIDTESATGGLGNKTTGHQRTSSFCVLSKFVIVWVKNWRNSSIDIKLKYVSSKVPTLLWKINHRGNKMICMIVSGLSSVHARIRILKEAKLLCNEQRTYLLSSPLNGFCAALIATIRCLRPLNWIS